METLKKTDSAADFVDAINGNFEEAGARTQFTKDMSAGNLVSGLNTAFGNYNAGTETLDKDDNAADFVGALNRNFGKISSVTPSASTISIPMQGGKMENGYITGRNLDRSNFLRYRHSVNMIRIVGSTITGVTTASGETLTVFCYSSNGAYLGTGTVGNLQSGTEYVKLMLSKSSNYASVESVIMSYSGDAPTLHKNLIPDLSVQKDVSFETSISRTFPGQGFVEGSGRFYDNGFIKLPSNYTMDGTPVPLVVFVHGTSGHPFSGTGDRYTKFYDAVQAFIVRNGYALCDCSGTTSRFTNSSSSSDYYNGTLNAMCAPSFAAAVVNQVEFLMANYNLRQEGIYLYGKSSGGLMVHLPLLVNKLHSLFTINAIGSLAPAVSPINSMRKYGSSTSMAAMNVTAAQLGISANFTLNSWTATEQSWVLGAEGDTTTIAMWRKVDGFFGCSLSDAEVKEIATRRYASNKDLPEMCDVKKQGYDAVVAGLISGAFRATVAPTKLWIVENDEAVSSGMTTLLAGMAVREAGTHPVFEYALLKDSEYPGGHHFDDIGTSAKQPAMAEVTIGGETVTTTAVYAQLAAWFNHYEDEYKNNIAL